MNRRNCRTPRRLIAVVLASLALVAAACGSDDEGGGASATTATSQPGGASTEVSGVPGVTKSEIRFAAIGTNSNNPLGTCILECYTQGIEAYFAFRNSTGGLDGRKLVLANKLDDELGKNQQRSLEVLAADDVFGVFGSPVIASGWKDLADASVPMWVWSIHPEARGRRSIFGQIGATCYTCPSRSLAYVFRQAKASRVAALGYGISENSKLCASRTRNTVEAYGKDVGDVQMGYFNDDLAFGLPNGVGPEVTAMKRAGVDLIVTCTDLNADKTIAQELQRQGMAAVPMYHPNMYDQRFVAAAGDVFEGDYVGVGFRPFEAGGEAIDLFETWMKKTGSDISELATIGWINAATAFHGIEAAGPQFDRVKVIEATNALEDFTADGMIMPLDFGRQHEPPTADDLVTHGNDPDCFAVVQVRDGKFTLIGQKEKPFICWPASSTAWTEPKAMDFE